MSTKLISMAVYGSDQRYLRGAIANAMLRAEYYPEWEMVVFCEKSIPTEELERLGCRVVRHGASNGHEGMFWRFLPFWWEGVERAIVRDADSRFNAREAAAVHAWEASGELAHCMHDHPHHMCLPLFGGMIGICPRLSLGVRDQMNQWLSRAEVRRVDDMRFLKAAVLPEIRRSLLRHADLPCPPEWGIACPFPPHPPILGHVGQQYTADGRPIFA